MTNLKIYFDIISTNLKKYFIPIVVTIMSFFVCSYIIYIGAVPTESMVPTLKVNSFFIGSRVNTENIKKGDVVVFLSDETESGNSVFLVKRIAAIGGETITVDGKTFAVPENCYFMLGDNSEHSYDSRYWKNPFVEKNKIVAKVILPIVSDNAYFSGKSNILIN